MKKAVLLYSGGLDSTTCLYWAKKQGYKVFALLFDYGQRHKKELKQALKILKKTCTPYQLVRFSLPWGGSALLDPKVRLPYHRNGVAMDRSVIPNTYVPARNTIFLSFAFSYAEAIRAGTIVMGANAIDFSGYPDCRPRYLQAIQKVAVLATKWGHEGHKIEIVAPLLRMSKSQIIRLGMQLKVPYALTWSCYEGGKTPCGHCDSCILRERGFAEVFQKEGKK